jgi:hypothetical protein
VWLKSGGGKSGLRREPNVRKMLPERNKRGLRATFLNKVRTLKGQKS